MPIGDGMVDLRQQMAALKELGFRGPVNLQVEHHGLLGGDVGQQSLAMTSGDFQEIVGRDLTKISAAMTIRDGLS